MFLNKLLQRCDRVGVRLSLFVFNTYLGEKPAVHLLYNQLSVRVKTVRVSIRDHPSFATAGVALYRLDIASAQFQLEGGAAVPETVEHHGTQVVLLNQPIEHLVDIFVQAEQYPAAARPRAGHE